MNEDKQMQFIGFLLADWPGETPMEKLQALLDDYRRIKSALETIKKIVDSQQ